VRGALPYYGIALADVAQQRADVLLLGLLAGPAVTGLYAGASSVVRVLSKLVQSYWRALYPTLSRLHATDAPAFDRLRRGALLLAVGLSAAAAGLGSVLAAPLFPLVFGPEFAASVPVFTLLVWSAPAYAISLYAVYVLLVAHRPRPALAVTLTNLVLTVLLLPPLAAAWGAPGAAAASLAAGVAAAGVGWGLLGGVRGSR
jgi:O-antigen/teichoic acid export membrane protein